MKKQFEKLRVTILADSANPEWVSVPLVGWKQASAIAELTECTLITSSRNRPSIEKVNTPFKNIVYIGDTRHEEFVYAVHRKFFGDINRGQTVLTLLLLPIYWLFELQAWFVIRALLAEKKVDIVHRLTPVSPRVTSFIPKFCKSKGLPFVLGPINGGLPWPKGFQDEQKKEGEILGRFLSLGVLIPWYKSMYADSSAVICGGRHVLESIDRSVISRCFLIPENGLDESNFPNFDKDWSDGCEPLRLVFVGRLVPLKGVIIALEALRDELVNGKIVFDIVGDGPEKLALEDMVARSGLTKAVTFHGWVEKPKVLKILSLSHLFIFPSFREFGGGAVLEAMALGLIPIVANYGGPGEIVKDSFGFRLSVSSRIALAQEIRTTVESLMGDTLRLAELSKAAMESARQEYLWNSKAEGYIEIYKWCIDLSVVSGNAEKRPRLEKPKVGREITDPHK